MRELDADRQRSLDHYKTEIYPVQRKSTRNLNLYLATNKQIDFDRAIDEINRCYDEKALNIAKEHGYKECAFEKAIQNHVEDACRLSNSKPPYANDNGITEETAQNVINNAHIKLVEQFKESNKHEDQELEKN